MSRRTRAHSTVTDTKPPRQPVASAKPHPAAWEQALAIAGGDAKRLHVEADGSVLVANARETGPAR